MNFELLDRIATQDEGFVATVVSTTGHTYQKAGARALFRPGDPFPVCGNLGSLCADQELVDQGDAAMRERRARVVTIDTTSQEDARLGYGTACGGVMEVLVEPLLSAHRAAYASLRERLANGKHAYLTHDLAGGDIIISEKEPDTGKDRYVEHIAPPRRLVIFGATPLAVRVAALLAPAGFDVHVCDWRAAYLESIGAVVDASRRHLGTFPVRVDTFVLILSHSFERDRDALRAALDAGCRYVGLLSSTDRRDRMFAELRAAGVADEALATVSSPVGLRTARGGDARIAVGIAAEIIAREES